MSFFHARLDRRGFVSQCVVGALAGTACGLDLPKAAVGLELKSKPRVTPMTLAAGTIRSAVDGTEFVTYVPESALAKASVPIMVLLHGAGRGVEGLINTHRPIADAKGVVIVAPYAVSGTWDGIRGAFGPDIRGIDRVLEWTFSRVPSAMQRVALSGFSDGATYSLALGLANGGLFPLVAAYSPGFLIDAERRGKPSVVISHGTLDNVLSYENTRDSIVPTLVQQGYQVEFSSFEGPHAMHGPTVEFVLSKLSAA
jgi:phospholipase/carboxylesterase